MSRTITSNEPKKVHFISLGCPKNLVDTEIMVGGLTKEGYQSVTDPEQADTIIVNTCGFIEDAKKESVQTILDMAALKTSGKLQKLVVAGCLTQRYKDTLVEELPEADLFVGSGEFQNIAKILKNSYSGSKEKKYFNLPTFLQEDQTPRTITGQTHFAYLKISEGCKKRCAFCAIPLIRGNLQSRKIESVVSEAKLLVASGVKELIVISHDFTDYGWDLRKKDAALEAQNSVELLKALATQTDAEWIRVMYLYPDGVSRELIDLMKQYPQILPYFDMPLQHINNTVLKNMNRRMTRVQIEEALTLIRTELPNAVIRTQFIVGFPGETPEQFEELVEFIEKWKFDRVGCFKYSIEENTKAGEMKDQIDESTKDLRFDRLMKVQKKLSRKQVKNFIGKELEVVVEGYSEETELLLKGRYWAQAPDIDGQVFINDGQAAIGKKARVKITHAHDYDLVGEII
jgi:ribosomal protein S12 methylthiotransferase